MGGVAKKSPYIMQMMADIINMPIRIHKSEQTCALGAAMFAATAAGIFARVEEAMDTMGQALQQNTNLIKLIRIYKKRYEMYKQLGGFIEQQVNAQLQAKDPELTLQPS
jgi:L-ribulokinase